MNVISVKDNRHETSNDHIEYVVEDIHYFEEVLRRSWMLIPVVVGIALWVLVN